MKIQHLLSAAAGLALVASTSTPSFAFMADGSVTGEAHTNPASMVAELKSEAEAGKTQCSVMLVKVNEAIAAIDTQLDAGVVNEASHLDARASLVSLRSDLPCLSEELAAEQGDLGMLDQGQVISDTLLSEQTIGSSVLEGGEVGMAGGASVGGSPMYAGGGVTYGGGGGGGGGGSLGGGGIGGIGALGALGAAIAIGVSDDDEPGVIVSPSN